MVAVAAAALSLFQSGLASSQGKPAPVPGKHYRMQWDDLGPLITGAQADLKLPNGARLRGKVQTVTPGALVLQVTKTSDRRAYPKGVTPIPREEVSQIRITKQRGHGWLVVGTAIGAAIGLVVGVPLAVYAANEGAKWAGLVAGVIAVPTAVGLLAGRSVDKDRMVITVEPPAPMPAKAP